MEMNDVFDKLKALQDILVEKYAIEKKIEEAPRTLSSQDELLARLKKEYIEKNETYDVLKSEIIQLRRELEETILKRERSEKGMDSITTHREYEALDKEIKDATAKEDELRNEKDKKEKKLADLTDDMEQAKQLIDSQQIEIDQGRESLDNTVNELKKALEDLENQQKELIPNLDAEIIFKFERIIKSKQKGIVAVKGNVCDGCHMILPAQFANEVRNGDDIVFCPYCSRILFYQEQDDGENEFFSMDDVGSLGDFEDETDDEELEDDESEDLEERESVYDDE